MGFFDKAKKAYKKYEQEAPKRQKAKIERLKMQHQEEVLKSKIATERKRRANLRPQAGSVMGGLMFGPPVQKKKKNKDPWGF